MHFLIDRLIAFWNRCDGKASSWIFDLPSAELQNWIFVVESIIWAKTLDTTERYFVNSMFKLFDLKKYHSIRLMSNVALHLIRLIRTRWSRWRRFHDGIARNTRRSRLHGNRLDHFQRSMQSAELQGERKW